MGAIRPIETIYKGYKFRSRLEARWAVFFDALGVEYEYEPEGFEKDGIEYLPDFRVMCYGKGEFEGEESGFKLYIEVKGDMREEDAQKIKTFAPSYEADEDGSEYIYRDGIPILVVSDIPNPQQLGDVFDGNFLGCYESIGFDVYPFNCQTIDGRYIGVVPAITADDKFYLMGTTPNLRDCHYPARLFAAYSAAIQARFEHGEKPFSKPVVVPPTVHECCQLERILSIGERRKKARHKALGQ